MSEQQEPPTTVRTACYRCGGQKVIQEEKMSVSIQHGEVFSAPTLRNCPECSDWQTPGWLPGLQPPV